MKIGAYWVINLFANAARFMKVVENEEKGVKVSVWTIRRSSKGTIDGGALGDVVTGIGFFSA